MVFSDFFFIALANKLFWWHEIYSRTIYSHDLKLAKINYSSNNNNERREWENVLEHTMWIGIDSILMLIKHFRYCSIVFFFYTDLIRKQQKRNNIQQWNELNTQKNEHEKKRLINHRYMPYIISQSLINRWHYFLLSCNITYFFIYFLLLFIHCHFCCWFLFCFCFCIPLDVLLMYS